ncbi:MAG: aminotransferase class I/II-fold pyridoxal phosphate-dependent enzyme, partial [Promethearchaeota archaeon]
WKSVKEVENELINKISGVIRSTISNSSHVAQQIVLNLMGNMESTLASRNGVIKILKSRWSVFNDERKNLERPEDGIYFDPFQGGFFAFLNLPEGIAATKFASDLIEKHAIGVIPIEKPDLGVNGIRIAYCSMLEDEIVEALKVISKALQE